MPLTTAQMVRGRLNDPYRRFSEVQYGDGTASGYKLQQGQPYSCLISATASVVTTRGWSATGCSIDTAQGFVTFSAVLPAGREFRVDGLWAVFGEDELAYFTAQGGIAAATLEGIRWLMGDAWKRAKWAAPDGTQYDDTKALDNLRRLYDTLQEELTGDISGPAGGIESWSVEQGNY